MRLTISHTGPSLFSAGCTPWMRCDQQRRRDDSSTPFAAQAHVEIEPAGARQVVPVGLDIHSRSWEQFEMVGPACSTSRALSTNMHEHPRRSPCARHPTEHAPRRLWQVYCCAWAVFVQELSSHLQMQHPFSGLPLPGAHRGHALHRTLERGGRVPAGSRCRTATGRWRCASPAPRRCAPQTPAARTAGRTACRTTPSAQPA